MTDYSFVELHANVALRELAMGECAVLDILINKIHENLLSNFRPWMDTRQTLDS